MLPQTARSTTLSRWARHAVVHVAGPQGDAGMAVGKYAEQRVGKRLADAGHAVDVQLDGLELFEPRHQALGLCARFQQFFAQAGQAHGYHRAREVHTAAVAGMGGKSVLRGARAVQCRKKD